MSVEISKLKGRSFVRILSTRGEDDESIYFVDEKIEKGIRTLLSTSDPLRARLYTLQEALDFTVKRLSEAEKNSVLSAHKEKSSYGGFFAQHFYERFRVLSVDYVNYSSNLSEEKKLLEEFDYGYLCNSVLTVEKSIDEPEEELK